MGKEPSSLRTLGAAAMSGLWSAWPKIRRIATSRQAVVTFITLTALWIVGLQLSLSLSEWDSPLGFISVPGFRHRPKRMTSAYNTLPPLEERVACYGPRGRLLSDSPDDALTEVELSIRTLILPCFQMLRQVRDTDHRCVDQPTL